VSAGDPMYALEKFGLQNPWILWRLQRGEMDQLCPRCRGKGVVIASPCVRRELVMGEFTTCKPATGCDDCRSTCPECRGSRLLPPEPLHAEDFGDEVSRETARRLLGGLDVSDQPRIDRNPRAL